MYYMDKTNVVAYGVTCSLMYYMDKNNVVAYSVFSKMLHSF